MEIEQPSLSLFQSFDDKMNDAGKKMLAEMTEKFMVIEGAFKLQNQVLCAKYEKSKQQIENFINKLDNWSLIGPKNSPQVHQQNEDEDDYDMFIPDAVNVEQNEPIHQETEKNEEKDEDKEKNVGKEEKDEEKEEKDEDDFDMFIPDPGNEQNEQENEKIGKEIDEDEEKDEEKEEEEDEDVYKKKKKKKQKKDEDEEKAEDDFDMFIPDPGNEQNEQENEKIEEDEEKDEDEEKAEDVHKKKKKLKQKKDENEEKDEEKDEDDFDIFIPDPGNFQNDQENVIESEEDEEKEPKKPQKSKKLSKKPSKYRIGDLVLYHDDLPDIDVEDASDLTKEEIENEINIKEIVCDMPFTFPRVAVRRKPWSRKETIALLRGMLRYGPKWSIIEEEYEEDLNDRNQVHLKDRWRIVKTKIPEDIANLLES